MANYVTLISWTEQGIKAYGDTVDRYQAANKLAGKFGAKLTQIYWTLGEYDVVGVLEAPDDESATAFALALSSQGNVRTKTMRAFDPDEMKQIVAKASG
jgi:uncharacterized protein with GYD domain